MLQVDEARKLLQLLRRDGGTDFAQASEAVKQGDYKKALPILKSLMENPDAERLLQQISEKLGRS